MDQPNEDSAFKLGEINFNLDLEIQNSEPNQPISREDDGDFAEEAIFKDESNKEDRN